MFGAAATAGDAMDICSIVTNVMDTDASSIPYVVIGGTSENTCFLNNF